MDKGYDYDEAYHMVCKFWIKKKEYKKLYNFFVLEVEGNYVEELNVYIDTFLEVGETTLYRNYWKGILHKANDRFWYDFNHHKSKNRELNVEKFLSYDINILEENNNKYPAYQDPYLNFVYAWHKIVELLDKYIEAMQKINAIEEIERVKLLKESIYNLKKPKAKKTTDKRKMNEELFWEFIEESRQECESDSEFVDILKDKLEAMSVTEIKKFQKILLEKTNELEHWDIWALAYIVRNGCGDDAFDYFKAWIISQGQDAFEYVKNMQIENLKKLFKNNDPQFEEFMYVAQEAYENKKNEMMPDIRVKSQEIQGEQWEESSICKSYPKLCKLFEYKD